MKRLMAVLVLMLVVLALTAVPAGAATSKDAFEAHLEHPNVSRASNGDTVEVLFEGEFDGGSKTASGEGSFVERAADGTEIASGTLTATRLVAFQFYGCGTAGGEEIPPDLCGGRALFDISFVAHPAQDPSVSIEGVGQMEINCQVGTPPPGTSEGTTIRVRNHGNFNEHVSGDNIFVAK